MSVTLDTADLIRDSLVANVTELAGITVLVDKEKNIDSTIDKQVARVNGLCVVIGFGGNKNIGGDAGGPLTESAYSVVVIGNPTLIESKSLPKVIEVAEACMKHLHGLNLAQNEHCYYDLEYVSMPLIKHPTFLVYDVKIKARIEF